MLTDLVQAVAIFLMEDLVMGIPVLVSKSLVVLCSEGV